MLSTQALREQMNRYAEREISAEALEEWLASESWDMRRWASRGLQQFVITLQGAFIRYSDGKMSADELNDFLHARFEQLKRAEVANRPFDDALRRAVAEFMKKQSEGALTFGFAMATL